MMKGQCNCGAVAFAVSAPLSDIYICHCSICRRSTGSNGIAVLVTEKQNFRWLQGETSISSWEKPGHDWQTWFCTNCGSTLPGVNDSETVFIPAPLVQESSEELRVAHHIWVDSRATWDIIGDSGLQHPRGFGTAPEGVASESSDK